MRGFQWALQRLLTVCERAKGCWSGAGDGLLAAGIDEVKFIHFHKLRHPEEMGAKEVEQYLTFLAAKRQVSARTQKQALCALVFLYGTVLGRELGRVMTVRGRHGRRCPS